MVTTGKHLEGLQVGSADVGDLYRAAWVQAVSAIDHWFHEELYRRVAELAAQDSGLPYQLTRFELPLEAVEKVLRGTVTLADAVAEHAKAKWANASLQNPRKISEALKLVTEKNVWAEAAEQTNEWFGRRTSMTEKSLKQKYISITDRRNKIAHEADLREDGRGRRLITEADVTDTINWIERIALAIAKVLDN